ncbi:BLUF domain-containing protein [Verminephrobacter eiseniae]|nr:BLUF domain-containing protein [Verminephrobacter eiseniae]MCW5302103.1 BLUF domain-containing protein [Verminephrobacter eiseniae]MCW8180543.1 BLUF domain-containing protein [Verminephrobacter eiseniae]MCW8191921.1 BLUF domain-containing protein [Verminephrobacter eiseniae]
MLILAASAGRWVSTHGPRPVFILGSAWGGVVWVCCRSSTSRSSRSWVRRSALARPHRSTRCLAPAGGYSAGCWVACSRTGLRHNHCSWCSFRFSRFWPSSGSVTMRHGLGRRGDSCQIPKERCLFVGHIPQPTDRISMSNEALSQFVYYSTLADGYDATCVGAIIKTARAFNASNGITGVLLFDGERFCQYIEGNPVAVNALVDRIRQNPRHKGVTTLFHEPLAAGRRYSNWSMAFSDVDGDAIIDQMISRAPHDALTILWEHHRTLDIG